MRNFLPYSDRFALLKKQAKVINIKITQIYASNAKKEHNEGKPFYTHLRKVAVYEKI